MYSENSPSKLNKSVTFDNQVRVREYGQGNAKQFATPERYTTDPNTLSSSY